MAKAPETDDSPTLWGMSTKTWVALFQNLGIPTLFMGFVCFMAYRWVPPIASAHIDLLQRTGDTLESMDDTLAQSNKMLEALANRSYPGDDFREMVHEEHLAHDVLIEECKATLEEIGAKIDKLNGQ